MNIISNVSNITVNGIFFNYLTTDPRTPPNVSGHICEGAQFKFYLIFVKEKNCVFSVEYLSGEMLAFFILNYKYVHFDSNESIFMSAYKNPDIKHCLCPSSSDTPPAGVGINMNSGQCRKDLNLLKMQI